MTKKSAQICLFLLLLTTLDLSIIPAAASSLDHRYNVGDLVPLFVNIVGPLNNPSETYQYYDLPFCRPDEVIPKKQTLGEVLNGHRLTNTLYELRFRDDKFEEILCDKNLKRTEISKLKNALKNDFYYQMYYDDDLPLWAFIGKIEDETTYYVFKHVRFDAIYNGDRVVEIRAFGDPNNVINITDKSEVNVKFTYSVFWNSSLNEYEDRMNKYSRAALGPTQRRIHLFSVVNSVVIVVLLVGLLVVMFMRHLKNDLRKFSGGDEEENNEVGWKYVHSDVFRCPSQMALFSAVLGIGTQLFTIICLLFILAFFGVLYPYNRGILSVSLVVFFILTAPIAGYTAASFFGQFSATGWEKCVLLTGTLYIGPLFIIILLLNTIAMSIGATIILPFGTIIVIVILYALIAVPLLAIGGVMGFRFRSQFQAPSAMKIKEIRSLTFYRKTPGQMFIAGLLPFSVIVLELHNFYGTIWGYKILTLPGVMFITFVFLVVLTALLSIALTYIQLTVEDHQWWWRSMMRGGSTAIFMFGYCIYYFSRSNMSGIMQLTFFFGYNFLICYAFFMILATISFRSSWIFVQRIYNAIKSE